MIAHFGPHKSKQQYCFSSTRNLFFVRRNVTEQSLVKQHITDPMYVCVRQCDPRCYHCDERDQTELWVFDTLCSASLPPTSYSCGGRERKLEDE